MALTQDKLNILAELKGRNLSPEKKAIVDELERRNRPVSMPKQPSALGQAFKNAQTSYGQSVPGMLAGVPDLMKSGANIPIGQRNIRIPGTEQIGNYAQSQLEKKGVSPLISKPVGFLARNAPDIVSAVAMPTEAIGQIGPAARAAEFMGSNALGFTKGIIKKLPKGQAEEAVKIALKERLIPFSGSPSVTAENLANLESKSGKAIGSFLESQGKKFNAKGVISEVESLRPRAENGNLLTEGPLYKEMNQAIDDVKDMIVNHGDEPMSFKAANKLKGEIQKIVNYGKEGYSTAKGAAAVFRTHLDNFLENISQQGGKAKEFAQFLKDKKTYGATQTLGVGMKDLLAARQGNMPVSLPSLVVAGASGNPLKAAATALMAEMVKRRGAGIAARSLYGISQKGQRAVNPLIMALNSNKRKK